MPEKVQTVHWGDLGKIVTNNAGTAWLTSTRQGPDFGKLVHRSAILADIEWRGTVSFEYLRDWDEDTGDPIIGTYSFTPAAWHQPVWTRIETSTRIDWHTESDAPAWGRYVVSDMLTGGPVRVKDEGVWTDYYFGYHYTYTLYNPAGRTPCRPEDCQFFFSAHFGDSAGTSRYLSIMRSATSWEYLRDRPWQSNWLADIGDDITLAKPFPNASTDWEMIDPTDTMDDHGCQAAPTTATWPTITPWGKGTGDFYNLGFRQRWDFSHATPVVTFHQEEPVDPTIPANP